MMAIGVNASRYDIIMQRISISRRAGRVREGFLSVFPSGKEHDIVTAPKSNY